MSGLLKTISVVAAIATLGTSTAGCKPQLVAVEIPDELEVAIRDNDLQTARDILRQNPASVNEAMFSEQTPLYLATRLERTDLIRVLIKGNADPFQKSRGLALGTTDTPIELAIRTCNLTLAKLMLPSGSAQPNPLDLELMRAALRSSTMCNEQDGTAISSWINGLD